MSAGTVIRGDPITLEAWYRLNGVLTDPGTPRVTVRDPTNVVVVLNATPVQFATGIYQYEFTPAIDAPLGTWTVTWTGTVSGQGVTQIEDFVVAPVGYVIPVPSMSFSYNLATDVGKVRLLIDDRDMSNATTSVPIEQRSVIFTDEEIAYFITQAGSVMLAAALGLRTIANNRSLLVQRRVIGRTDVDYGSLRRDLLASASAIETADREAPADGIAEIVWDDFTLRDIYVAETLRHG